MGAYRKCAAFNILTKDNQFVEAIATLRCDIFPEF